MKQMFFLMLLMFFNSFCNNVLISHRGKIDSKIFVYDHQSKTSATLKNFSNPEVDNGHCVQVQNNGQKVTIVIPEDLSKFQGVIGTQCELTDYTSSCQVLTGQPISFGETYIQNNELKYGNTSSPIPISFVCQNMGFYIQNNFGAVTKIVEYAKADPNDHSYCSITFTPNNTKEDLKIGINPDTLFDSNHLQQNECYLKDYDKQAYCEATIPALNPWDKKQELCCVFDITKTNMNCYSGTNACTTQEYTENIGGTSYSQKPNCSSSLINNQEVYTCTLGQNIWHIEIENENNPKSIKKAYPNFITSLVFENFDYCGFCTSYETTAVGKNPKTSFLEDGTWGSEGLIYPFATDIDSAPTCDNGFIANFPSSGGN